MKNFKEHIKETVGGGGLEYESKVEKVLTDLATKKYRELKIIPDVGGGFSNRGSGDLTLIFGGKKAYVEIKQNKNAQMGGTSVRYDGDSPFDVYERFEFVGGAAEKFDEDTKYLFLDALVSKIPALDYLLEELQALDPVSLHGYQEGFPLNCTVDAWDYLVKKGFIKPINAVISMDTTFIKNHYLKKKVDYIQIGGSGLFHFGKNPLRLPVPEIKGKLNVELRAGAGGSKFSPDYGTKIRPVGLRIQGRLKFDAKSPYSLDNEKSADELLGKYFR